MQQEVLTPPSHNTITGFEQAPVEDMIALGAASMDAVGFEFSSADLAFLAGAGIDSDSLSGNLSIDEEARLMIQDEKSAEAATTYFTQQDAMAAEAASRAQVAAAAQAERTHVQFNILDAEEAAKKKKQSVVA